MVRRNTARASRVKEWTSIRWMNTWAVEVQVSKEKADGRAEMACTRVRRKRGLRLGRSRSRERPPVSARARGGKPRSLVENRPPVPRDERSRPFNRALRTFDFWEGKHDEIRNFIVSAPKEEPWFDNSGKPRRRYLYLRRLVHGLNRGCTRCGEGASFFLTSPSHLLEKHRGVTAPGSRSASKELGSMLDSLVARTRPVAPPDTETNLCSPGSLDSVRATGLCRFCGQIPWLDEAGRLFCRTHPRGNRAVSKKAGRYKKKGASKRNQPSGQSEGNFASGSEITQRTPGMCRVHPASRLRSGVCRLCRVNHERVK